MDTFRNACEEVGLVGSRFLEELAVQVQSAVLARRGRDVVRLTGPTGTGKELVSSLLHRLSIEQFNRSGELVEVSCTNLPPGHLERTLFGIEEGRKEAPGLLQQATGGTLVLDEIHSLSLEDQGKLLRVLGEREYRPLGSSAIRRTDALIVLVSNIDLLTAVARGEFRGDLLDRAPAQIALLPLWQRREDIAELAQSFAQEAAADREWSDFHGLTRRARADLEGAIVDTQEHSVRRLRDLVRDAVFSLEAPVSALDSSLVAAHIESHFGVSTTERERWDREDLDQNFDLALEAQTLARLAQTHGLPENTLIKLAKVLREVYDALPEGENPVPGSYRNLVTRMNVATKAALWLLSGATNQAEFRKFFGTKSFEMPPKSVAWQIYHDLFSAPEEPN